MKKSSLEECRVIECNILESVKIPVSEFEIKECVLSDKSYIHYIQINKVPITERVILMTHGYLGSNMSFFKMYKQLMDHYHIISFDLPGQGLSSSEKITPQTIMGWIDYFLNKIKAFVDKLQLKKFDVLGHSLGAYILTHFAYRYPEMVQQLFLLSPPGVNRKNTEFTENGKEFFKNQGATTNFFFKQVFNKMFKSKKSPMDFFGVGLFRGLIAEKIYKNEKFRFTEKEQELFISLNKTIFKSEPSSEKCVGYLFKNGPMSNKPLLPIFQKLHQSKKIHIFYGALDWMDFEKTILEIKKHELNVTIEFIEDASHQIPFQNPYGAVNSILNKLYAFD